MHVDPLAIATHLRALEQGIADLRDILGIAPPPPQLLKIGEVCSHYRVHESTARRWAATLGVKIEGVWFVDAARLEARGRR